MLIGAASLFDLAEVRGQIRRYTKMEPPRRDQLRPRRRSLPIDDLPPLRAKLLEEVEELLAAPDDKRVEEVADVVEVLYAMVEHYGLDWDEVEVEGLRKRHEKGGFEGRIWLQT
jgi:predicted house-cleaning noncanonical NTP pyrophosphatase (MazG superfamily)